MTSHRTGRHPHSHHARSYPLSLATRSIRAVLAGSAAILAMTGSSAAFAGTCTVADNVATCDGAFANGLPDAAFAPVVDMSLVLGGGAPTSVTALFGVVGIEAAWGGNVGISSSADITTAGADGIHQVGTTSATLANHGTISTDVSADGVNAVDISALGDVIVDNDGAIDASATGVHDVTALNAYSTNGSVTINNVAGGTIAAQSTDGNALAVQAYVFGGTALIDNAGDISAHSIGGDASGVYARASMAEAAGAARVINSGSIDVASDAGNALGIYASSEFGQSAVSNSGSINVVGSGEAIGVAVSAPTFFAQLTNQGSISVVADHSAIGAAMTAGVYGLVSNSGTISATATGGDATAFTASAPMGEVRITTAATSSFEATGGVNATGLASVANISKIYNYGGIVVRADEGLATGIASHTSSYSWIANNPGGVIDVASSGGAAIGMDISSELAYSANVFNSSQISVTGATDATGIVSMAGYFARVQLNDGSLDVHAGTGDAVGVLAQVVVGEGNGVSAVSNGSTSSLSVDSAFGSATGIWALSMGSDSLVTNAGQLTVAASHGVATGIGVDTLRFTDGAVSNSGTIDVLGYQAMGIAIDTYAGVARADNSGTISVAATAVLARASGIDAQSELAAEVSNSGTISVEVGTAEAVGIHAVGTNDRATVVNGGDIAVHSNINDVSYGGGPYYAGRDYARAIIATSEHATTVHNIGSINADATFHAQGIRAYVEDGQVTVTNGADADIAVNGQFRAWGIEAFSFIGNVAVENAGTIDVVNLANPDDTFGYNLGIYAGSNYGAITTVVNSGSISILGDVNDYSVGIRATSNFGQAVAGTEPLAGVLNSGDLVVEGSKNAMGIVAAMFWASGDPTQSGDLLVDNSGTVVVSSEISSYGVLATHQSPLGAAAFDNSGSITATSGLKAFAVEVDFHSGAATTITNSGDVLASTGFSAIGMYARYTAFTTDGVNGTLAFDNSGSIFAEASNGDMTITPYILSTRVSGAQFRISDTDVTATNSGSITAISTTDLTNPGFAIARVTGMGVENNRGDGTIEVTNTGSISSSLVSDGRRAAWSNNAVGMDIEGSYGFATVLNAGLVSASAETDASTSVGELTLPVNVEGIRMSNDAYTPGGFTSQGDMTVTNVAGGVVQASGISNFGDASIRATGIYAGLGLVATTLVSADNGITIHNAGLVTANADVGGIDVVGTGTANGLSARTGANSQGFITVDNSGRVFVTSTAIHSASAVGITALTDGPLALGLVSVGNTGLIDAAATATGTAQATGVLATAENVAVELGAGSAIQVAATGSGGSAIGLSVAGTSVTASNAGTIEAGFTGSGNTFGARLASSSSDLTFTNSGSITATAVDNAIGVQLNNATANTLINSGTVSSVSDGAGSFAVRARDSSDTIQNTGAINGALSLGAGNDVLTNGATGTWNAVRLSTFGDGDDSIVSSGTIHLDDATIDLGSHDVLGNRFDNTGVIRVSGDNVIDMGSGNPFAFNNNGSIDFRNGVVGDTLHILGNLGGGDAITAAAGNAHCACNFTASAGSINFDVSGASGTSDLLYIDGNVQAGTINNININLLDLPTAAFTNIAMLFVSGDSTASSFRLGQVNYDPNGSFMTLRFNLVSSIDATNATPDVFSLGATPGREVGRPLTPAGKGGGVLTDPGVRGSGGGTGGKPTIAGNDPGKPAIADIEDAPASGSNVGKETIFAGSGINAKALAAPAGLEVTGLSDSGTLAASLAPGVQSLLNSQVGTWRQRTGVIDQFRKGGVALWLRLFQDSGKVSPDHIAGNFGQGGNFDFDQRNSGIEVGADFAITDALSVGLLVAKADGRQTLQDGAGVSRIDGDTFGGYATWIADGFYLDASYRHMSFDALLRTSSGENRTSGDADAFSLEGGYAWTVGDGFKIEPQLQYTRISVDDTDALQGTLATFHSTGGVLSRGRLGVMGRKSFAAGSAVWTPYATLSAVREFDGKNGFNINGDFFGETSVEGTSALVEAGLTVQAGKLGIFGGINWQDGGAVDSIVSGQLGLRYGW